MNNRTSMRIVNKRRLSHEFLIARLRREKHIVENVSTSAKANWNFNLFLYRIIIIL